jgi:hypothetical protein
LPLPVEFGGVLNLFLPRHRETQEANATRLALRKPMLMRWVPR